MFWNNDKDRFSAHTNMEEKKKEFDTRYKKFPEEYSAAYGKVSDEIHKTGTNEMKQAWTEFTTKMLIKDMFTMTDMITNSAMGKMFTEFSKSNALGQISCLKEGCDGAIVQDGVYKKSNKKESLTHEIEEFVHIKNQFVCLSCGTKHIIIKK